MLGRMRPGRPVSGRQHPTLIDRLLGARTGELGYSFNGDVETAPIPVDPCGPTAHAGHRGFELRDTDGRVVVREGRSWWLCLEHNVAVRAPRAE
jgi:hypothetical protein